MMFTHLKETEWLGDIDGPAWNQIMSDRGGCYCFISSPCNACTSPITEEELNSVGYTYEEEEEMQEVLTCPKCDSDQVTVTEETSFMVNTMEHYCHSVKAHDSTAKVSCLKCDWAGERKDLIGHMK